MIKRRFKKVVKSVQQRPKNQVKKRVKRNPNINTTHSNLTRKSTKIEIHRRAILKKDALISVAPHSLGVNLNLTNVKGFLIIGQPFKLNFPIKSYKNHILQENYPYNIARIDNSSKNYNSLVLYLGPKRITERTVSCDEVEVTRHLFLINDTQYIIVDFCLISPLHF